MEATLGNVAATVVLLCLLAAPSAQAGCQPGSVIGWGWNGYGQINAPAGVTNTVAVAAGGYHSLALKADGTVMAWGANAYGQTNVPAGLTNVAAIAAGFEHNLGLRDDGSVVAWGNNSEGQTNVASGLTIMPFGNKRAVFFLDPR